jgi:deoxycytidylate deaminase
MLFAQGNLDGCKIYVLGMTPCNVCARMMLQKGISQVIVVNPMIRSGGADWNFESTFNMFNQANILYKEIKVPFVNIERPINLDC